GGYQHRIPVYREARGSGHEAGILLPRRQRKVCHRLSRHGRPPYEQYRFFGFHGHRPGHQPSRKRKRAADWGWMECALPSAHGSIFLVFRQGFSLGVECCADDVGGARGVDRRDAREVTAAHTIDAPMTRALGRELDYLAEGSLAAAMRNRTP